MLKLVKRKSSKQSSHEKVAEADGRMTEKNKEKEKGKKSPATKEKNSLQLEIESLRDEVCSLKEQLQENEKKTEQLRSQKTQQICALTFKLANAMRQREKAEDEVKHLKEEIENLKSQLQQSETTTDLTSASEIVGAKDETGELNIEDGEFSDPESVNSDDTAILCTSTNLLELERRVENAEQRAAKDQPKELLLTNGSDFQALSSKFHGPVNASTPLPTSENKDINYEFTNIKNELRSVRDSMGLMQDLNQQLSDDLQQFSEFQKCFLVGKKATRSPVRRSKLGSRRTRTLIKGKESGSSSSSSPESMEEEEAIEGGALSRVPDLLNGSSSSLMERPCKQDSPSKAEKEVQVTSDSSRNKRTAVVSYEEEIRKAEERARQLEDEDESLRQQLKKVITHMETIKADNNEMKEELKKLQSPTKTDSEFLIRTTLFTDQLLREMKQRDAMVRQNLKRMEGLTSKELAHSEISGPTTRTAADTQLVNSAQELQVTQVTNASSSLSMRIPKERQETGCTPESLAECPSVGATNWVKNLSEECGHDQSTLDKGISTQNAATVTVPETGLAVEDSETAHTDELANTSEKKREDEDSPACFRSILCDAVDYGIKRYVVRSSQTIANLRDLKPEELAYY